MEGFDDDMPYVGQPKTVKATFIEKGRETGMSTGRGDSTSGQRVVATHAVEGLNVAFPYEPYACQLDFMAVCCATENWRAARMASVGAALAGSRSMGTADLKLTKLVH